MIKDHYKVIVVGSGPGGSVAASLCAEKGHEVLLLEEGSDFSSTGITEFSTDEVHSQYRDGGLTAAVGNSIINYAEGNCVGGGSEINSGLFHEVPEEILKRWESKNSIKFNRKDLEQAYSEIRKDLNISLMPKNKIPSASLHLKEASNRLSWNCSEVPRWYKYDKDGKGIKQSMTRTLIPKFIHNGGRILSNSKVLKIRKNSNTNLVDVYQKDGSIKVFSCDYLFISCGSIQTPSLFLRSGIKKNVGVGLKVHPTFKFTALFDHKVNSPDMGVPVHQIKEFSPDISIGCSISNKPFLGVSLNDCDSLDLLNQWEKMATYYSMICPSGSGRVRHLPFFRSPLVTFKLSDRDKKNIYKSITLLAKVLFEAGAIQLFPSAKSKPINSYKEISKIISIPINKINLMTVHLFSSMQMGGIKASHPVTPEGNLWEDKSIYVSDGSFLCDSPSVNPQGSIMALARINTLNFLENLK